MANMVSNQSSTTSYKSFSCKDRIAIIIINMFLLLFGISDIIMMKFFKFLNIPNFIDDIIMFLIFIIFTFFAIINKCFNYSILVAFPSLGLIVGFILKGIGLSQSSQQIKSDKVLICYILLNFSILFLRFCIYVYDSVLPQSERKSVKL